MICFLFNAMLVVNIYRLITNSFFLTMGDKTVYGVLALVLLCQSELPTLFGTCTVCDDSVAENN